MELNLKLEDHELERVRGISIHGILGIENHGRKIMMRCPFHNERTGSFCLYPDNTYHCYGCTKHGNNALDFMLEISNGRFLDAVYELTKYL